MGFAKFESTQEVGELTQSSDLKVTLDGEEASIGGVTAAKLAKGASVAEKVTCAVADTDNAAAGPIPAGTHYVEVYCASACLVAIGEATVAATLGRAVPGGMPATFPVVRTGTAADDTVHVQSAAAGAVVRLNYVP